MIEYEECISSLDSLALIRNINDDTDDEPDFLFTPSQINMVRNIIRSLTFSFPVLCLGPDQSIVLYFDDDDVGILSFYIYRDLTIKAKMCYSDNTCTQQMVSLEHMFHMIGVFTECPG